MEETIVYKLGGSLFTLPDLRQRLERLLSLSIERMGSSGDGTTGRRLFVVGGGATADVVRQWEKIHSLGDERAHHLAMRSMSFNAEFVAALFAKGLVVASREQAMDAWGRGCIAVLAAAEFVEAEERASQTLLPRSWEVTADSVAAYVAVRWPARALVLVKSVPLLPQSDLSAEAGVAIDPRFAELAQRIPVIGWTNLRAGEPTIERLTLPRAPSSSVTARR